MSEPNPAQEQDLIERLRYIAESPTREHGGFHENAIQTAKDAIAALAVEREKTKDAQDEALAAI